VFRFAIVKSERLVLGGRAVLAAGGLAATWIDPTQPTQSTLGYAVLGSYVAFSLALLVTLRRPLAGRWAVATHALDIAFISLIIIATEGASSPFFIYFTFILLAAALRWQAPGAIITGTVLSALLITLTASAFVVDFAQADVDRLIIRNIYLVVVSGLIAFFGEQLGRVTQQLERLRLTQQIHDGVLQTLTAVGLKLHSVAAQVPAEQSGELLRIAQVLKDEQRQLRSVVQESRTGRSVDRSVVAGSVLRPLVGGLTLLWGCDIALTLAPPDAKLPEALLGELRFLIGEGVANAAFRGQAKHVAVSLTQKRKTLILTMEDDGKGMPQGGIEQVYDLDQLAAANIGPRSICHRVAQLCGQLRLANSPRGIELRIVLPFPAGVSFEG
jgi:signal transduction histidine kinase